MINIKEMAEKYLVGGVSCGWNAMNTFGATHFSKAEGCRLTRIDGKKFIDYSMGWGSLFLGHNNEIAKKSFEQAFNIGFGMQYETEYHVKLAELLCNIIPCADKVRFTNTGTESTLFAIRMARSYTGKEKIIKFEGHFHGVHDYLNFANDVPDKLGKRRSDGTIEPLSGSSGIPIKLEEYVIPIAYNDIDTFEKTVSLHKNEIAGVIVEPICLASAIMFPQNYFLNIVRELCTDNNIVLIFDEVMSGFRENIHCAQATVGIEPDIATFSKILGGGFIISAIAGKEPFMNVLDPVGDCVASGTNIGRLLSVIGSYNTIKFLDEHPDIYGKHKENSEYFINEINKIFNRLGVEGCAKGYGGRMTIYFGSNSLEDNYEYIVKNWNKKLHMTCYKKAYDAGLYGFLMPLTICPEPICLTPAHKLDDINETLNIFESILKNSI